MRTYINPNNQENKQLVIGRHNTQLLKDGIQEIRKYGGEIHIEDKGHKHDRELSCQCNDGWFLLTIGMIINDEYEVLAPNNPENYSGGIQREIRGDLYDQSMLVISPEWIYERMVEFVTGKTLSQMSY